MHGDLPRSFPTVVADGLCSGSFLPLFRLFLESVSEWAFNPTKNISINCNIFIDRMLHELARFGQFVINPFTELPNENIGN
jgi:hypothetical protein